MEGFYEIANELLKAGADVNARGDEQITPLQDAVKEGHYKVYSKLITNYGLGIEIIIVESRRSQNLLHVASLFRLGVNSGACKSFLPNFCSDHFTLQDLSKSRN